MKTIYIDRLFLINLIADYLLCLICARFCGLYLRRKRYLLSAVIGAAYSVLTLVPGLELLNNPVLIFSCLLVMALLSYGDEEKLLRTVCVFLAFCAGLGGAVWAVSLHIGSAPGRQFGMLIIVFLICYGLLHIIGLGKTQCVEKKFCKIELDAFEKRCSFTALRDSGNCLRDSVSGSRVIIITPGALRPLLGEYADILESADSVAALSLADGLPELKGRLRLLPYSSLAGTGMLLAFRPDRLTIDGSPDEGILAAVSSRACGEGFEAIL